MKVKRSMFGIIALLTIIILAGCESPQVPASVIGAEKLTAKEALDIMDPAKEALGVDGVLVYIYASSSKDLPVTEGAASIWIAGFYSKSEKAIQDIQYFAWLTSTDKSEPQLWGEPRNDISLTSYDLKDWNIDSPKACSIAAQNGAGELDIMRLQTTDLEAIDIVPNFENPEFIPKSAKLFWAIRDENWDIYYIDACTGDYLGNVKHRHRATQ